MCLIVVKPKNIDLPPEWHLRNGDDRNSDGIGVMFWKKDGNEVHIKKDFNNVNELIEWMKTTINKEDILVIHFRMATSGLKDKGNRHPFPVTVNKTLLRQTELVCQMGVAHNGVLTEYSGHKTYSDTQKFVVDILSDPMVHDHLDNPAIYKLINTFLEKDRLTILDNQGKLFLFGEYEVDGGRLYSNWGYNYGKYAERATWWDKKGEEIDINKALVAIEGECSFNECDGCFKRTFIKNIEWKNDNYQLCKKCRKKLKKGQLNHLVTNNEIIDKEPKCDNCGIPTLDKDLKNKSDFKLCKKCYPIIDLTNV